VLARSAARERRIPEAIAAWRAVAASTAQIPGLPPASQASLKDDAPYFAAWLHFDAGDLERAASELSRLAREHPGSRRADDARWFAAWALIRKGAVAQAEGALSRVGDVSALPRVRYWRARIATDPAVARSLLESVVSGDPLGYYGLLACARLRHGNAPCPVVPLPAGRPPPELTGLADAPRLRQAALLASLGLRDEAIAELTELSGSNGGRRAAPLAAELALFIGDPLLPFRVARDQLGLSRRTLAWSFPDAWPRLVGSAARAAAIDPALLRAVMRRESGFRTGARSPAGAIGLLQVVPATAARLSTLLRLPTSITDRLEEPSVNVPLGAGYFALLLERFGDPLVAIASYNAGPTAVVRWSRDRASMPLDEWVESIPYRETRQYVRAVVENWAGARAAAGEPQPEIDPARVLAAPGAGVEF
jgi:soluble lytic murein transglycosylase